MKIISNFNTFLERKNFTKEELIPYLGRKILFEDKGDYYGYLIGIDNTSFIIYPLTNFGWTIEHNTDYLKEINGIIMNKGWYTRRIKLV